MTQGKIILIGVLTVLVVSALMISHARIALAHQPPSFTDVEVTFTAVSADNQDAFRMARDVVAYYGVPHPSNRLIVYGNKPLAATSLGEAHNDTIWVPGASEVSWGTWAHEIFHTYRSRNYYPLPRPLTLKNGTEIVGVQGLALVYLDNGTETFWTAYEEGAAEHFAIQSFPGAYEVAYAQLENCVGRDIRNSDGGLEVRDLLHHQTQPAGLLLWAQQSRPHVRDTAELIWEMVSPLEDRPGQPYLGR